MDVGRRGGLVGKRRSQQAMVEASGLFIYHHHDNAPVVGNGGSRCRSLRLLALSSSGQGWGTAEGWGGWQKSSRREQQATQPPKQAVVLSCFHLLSVARAKSGAAAAMFCSVTYVAVWAALLLPKRLCEKSIQRKCCSAFCCCYREMRSQCGQPAM